MSLIEYRSNFKVCDICGSVIAEQYGVSRFTCTVCDMKMVYDARITILTSEIAKLEEFRSKFLSNFEELTL